MCSIITRFEDDMDRVTNKMVFVQKGVDKLLKQKGESHFPVGDSVELGEWCFAEARLGVAIWCRYDEDLLCGQPRCHVDCAGHSLLRSAVKTWLEILERRQVRSARAVQYTQNARPNSVAAS